MTLTKEQIEKAMTCKSARELFEMAKTNGVECSMADAEKFFSQLDSCKEIDISKLEDIAGGCITNLCAGDANASC